MKLFPSDENTREELFAFLGVQGGTCHLLPDLIRVQPYNGIGVNLITENFFIHITIHHVFGCRVEVFHKYRFISNGVYTNTPKTEEEIAFDKNNPDSPKGYIQWGFTQPISLNLKHWFINYARLF